MIRIFIFSILFSFFTLSCSSRRAMTPRCVPTKSFAKIIHQVEIEKCNKKVKSCVEGQIMAFSGSAISIFNSNKSSYFLTVGHICQKEWNKTFYKEVKKHKTRHFIQIHTGDSYEAKIFKIHKDFKKGVDLCILKAKRINIRSINLASGAPEIGETVYSIGAPGGIYHPPAVPVLSGHYSGDIKDSPASLTTIFATGGSSGSAVLDTNFEIVGVIFAAHISVPQVSLMIDYKITRDFVLDHSLEMIQN